MELHQCLGWVESQSETPILGVLSALLRNFYWYVYKLYSRTRTAVRAAVRLSVVSCQGVSAGGPEPEQLRLTRWLANKIESAGGGQAASRQPEPAGQLARAVAARPQPASQQAASSSQGL